MLSILLVPCLLVAACGGDDDDVSSEGSSTTDQPSGKPIKVGVLGDRSGQLTSFGKAVEGSVQQVVDELNANGGLLGRQLEVVMADMQSDPSTAIPKAQELVENEGVDVVVGLMLSSVREAIAPYITEDNDLIFLHTTLYEGGACNENIFNTGPVPSQQVAPLIEYAVGEGAKTFSIVAHDYVYGREMASLAKDMIADSGGTVLSENYYPFETTDFGDAVRIVNRDKADVILNLLIVPGTIGFYNQLGASGNSAMVLHPGLDEVGGAAIKPDFLKNVVVALDWVRSLTETDAVSERVASEFDAITGGDPPFSGAMMTTGGYRAMRLWAEAVEKAGTLEAADVRKAMVGLTVDDGPGGAFEMNDQHHTVMNVYLAEFSDDGSLSTIETRKSVDPEQRCGF